MISDIYTTIMANEYLQFLFILAVSLAAAFLGRLIIRRILKPLAKKTRTKIDDLIIKSISSIMFYILLVIGVRIGLQSADIIEEVSSSVMKIIDSLLIIIVCIMMIRIIDNFSRQWLKEWKYRTKTTADERIIPLLQKVLKAVVIILGVIFVFNAWRIDISPLLATAGIAGVALGLAVKDSLSNILGGLQLVLDKTFKVGDKVRLESGELGVILDIGLRSTKLKTYDNEVIFVPNGILANAKIRNYTQPDLSIRVNVNFGVEYGSDPEKVRRVVMEAVKNIEGVLPDPEPAVQFLEMSDFSLDFIARAWVKEYLEAYSMKLKMTDAIYAALKKADIGIPFPTRTVFMKNIT